MGNGTGGVGGGGGIAGDDRPAGTAAGVGGSAGGGTVTVPVGYTDAVLPVSSWPAVTLGYTFDGPRQPGGGVDLTVTVTPQPAATAPAADPDQVRAAAERQAERYAAAYYQLIDGRLTATLHTTLRPGPDGDPVPLAVDSAPLLRFAAAGYAAARAAAGVRPVLAGGTLAGVCDAFGVTLEQVAATNAAGAASVLLGLDDGRPVPIVPAFVVFAAGETANGIAGVPRPAGWPPPTAGSVLLALPGNADVLPLRPGVVLRTPDRWRTVGGGDPSLDQVAADLLTTAGVLADDNALAPGVLAPGFVFGSGGLQVTVPEDPAWRLEDVRLAFAAAGVIVSVATLGTENGGLPGMFRPAAELVSRHYQVGSDVPETLGTTRSSFQAPALAAVNGATVDVFDDGALVYLGDFRDVPAPEPGERLDAYAARFGCPPAQLLAANAGVPIADDAVVVPGTVTVPDGPDAPRVPYSVGPGEGLTMVAGRFGTDALALGEANRNLPGTVTPGLTVTVPAGDGSVSTLTVAGDGFESVYLRLAGQDPRVTFPELIAVLAPVAGTLAAGALLLCPPARLTGVGPAAARGTAATAAAGQAMAVTGDPVLSPTDLGAAYHVDPALIAQANLGTLGLIEPGVDLDDPFGVPTVKTRAQDTFNSLTARFAQAGVGIDTTALIAANLGKEFLRAGAVALLPVAPARLTAALGPEPAVYPEPYFPLSTVLRLSRPRHLVDPLFRTPDGSGPAERADTVVPAPAEAQGTGDSASLTLAAFAGAFHAAFPALRLGGSRVADQARPQDVTADLWVVDFRPGGIASVDLRRPVKMPDGTAAPRFFALRPLYHDLVTRTGVPIQALRSDGELVPPEEAVPTDFQGVDTEVPARRLLADVDLLLSAKYAPGLYRDVEARTSLKRVLAAKRTLAAAVANGLASVLDVGDDGAAAGLAAAVEAVAQQSAVSLSSAYDTAAVVQYQAFVDSPWTRGTTSLAPARLSGTAARLAVPAGASGAGAGSGSRSGSGAGSGSAAGPVVEKPYTLTAAKVALDAETSALTFLMRVPDPALHGSVPVNLGYDVLDLEFGVRPVDGVEGYEDSDWLAFYPPLAGDEKPNAIKADLGFAAVPIPLRAYPALPSLIGQSAAATAQTDHPDLGQARLWTYALTYTHEHAEQDEVLVTARFNVRPEPAARAAGAEDVATALLRYVSVADGLWTLLGRFADDGSGSGTGSGSGPTPDAVNAAATFADLVTDVAEQWAARWAGGVAAPAAGSSGSAGSAERADGAPELSDGAPETLTYDFHVRVQYSPDVDGVMLLEKVYLSVPVPDDAPHIAWPAVLVRDPDGVDVPLTPGGTGDYEHTYTVPPPTRVPAGEPPILTLEWPGLPVSAFQNARGELSVRRNASLLDGGPLTDPAFVYRTPLIQSPAPIAPMLTWPQPVDITMLGADLPEALKAAFRDLTDPVPGLPATVGAAYGYPVIVTDAAETDLMAYVPVTLAPDSALTPAAADALTAEVESWQDRTQPAPIAGRRWAFALTVHSQLDPGTRQPLLSMGQVVYRIAQ